MSCLTRGASGEGGAGIFGPNRNEAILGRRKYENTGPNDRHNLYYSPNKVPKPVQNPNGMGWANRSTVATTNEHT